MRTPPRISPRPAWLRLATAAGLTVAVTVALYAFGRIHTPDFAGSLFGRRGDDANLLKAQVGTALLGLAVYQLISALWIYQRLPGAGAAPRPVHLAHRIGGAVLFVLSLPIAYHCITAYGVQTDSARVALHSLSGCFFYGAFAAKMLIVRSRRLPGWALPLAGGTLVTLIAILWSSAALWQLVQP
ncbi:DUF6529 family protein [Planotetraspora mira]|uniref:Uncharacterized protein n=1 Tax=Planotetraspora mira TaxID=58121 RepID=A0A8J3U413_9ACTN|nr:DUF6529 family protein [Planotetraspora mira]GII32370.1 hypothetical protein Pmi06nite_58120 [Planotetraspora mira]